MRRNYFLFLFFTVIVINTSPIGTLMLLSQNITEIIVKDQNDFDGLNEQLIKTINGIQSNIEHQVLVKFQSNSTFLFNDKNKIYFNNIEKPNVELVFTTTSGEQDVNIISDGIKYVRPSDYSSYLNDEGSHFYKKLKTRHSKRETYLDQDLKIVPLMNSGSLSDIGMNVATTKIFEVDSTTAKMGISDDLKERLSNIGETDLKNCLLYLESWFRIHQLQIKKLEGNTLFFYYDQDPYDKSFEHVINGDFYYSGQLPQFYITNHY